MLDCFALLEQSRRPWLDPETLKQKFLAASAAVHPDRVHEAPADARQSAQARFTDLTTAYNRLREPRDRLRHLLELELGVRPPDVQPIPQHLVDLFMEISALTREADAMLKEQAAISSPLIKVQFFERAQEMIAKLTTLQQQLRSHTDRLLAELKQIDADWISVPAEPQARRPLLLRLEQLYPLLGYFGRWSSQIQERIVRLSF